MGVRFQRVHLRHTTQRRPRASSKASRRPTGKVSITWFEPRCRLQNMQFAYTAAPWRGGVRAATDRTARVPWAVGRSPARLSPQVALAQGLSPSDMPDASRDSVVLVRLPVRTGFGAREDTEPATRGWLKTAFGA